MQAGGKKNTAGKMKSRSFRQLMRLDPREKVIVLISPLARESPISMSSPSLASKEMPFTSGKVKST